MFEDSIMESAGKTSPNSKWMMLGSVTLQGLALVALLVVPILYPEALPRLSVPNLLLAPPQSRAPATQHQAQTTPAAARPAVLLLNLSNVSARISTLQRVASIGAETGPPQPPGSAQGPFNTGIADGMPNIVSATPPPVVRATPKGPVKVSSGVAAGQLLTPIRPVYPRVAIATRTEGTVIVEATISRLGTIENLRVVAGPALLQGAAVQAIRAARYRPFILDGEAVEVETTISVVFTLGS
jgi:protein TonB